MSANGFAATSMRQLADECGVNVAALYHYFKSKQELFDAVLTERHYENRFPEAPKVDETASPAERLGQMFEAVWAEAMLEEPIWRLAIGESFRTESPTDNAAAVLLRSFPDAVAVWCQELIPEFTRPDVAANLLVGQIVVTLVRRVLEPEISADDLGAMAARHITNVAALW